MKGVSWRRRLIGLAAAAVLACSGVAYAAGDVEELARQLENSETQRERDTAAYRLASRPQPEAIEVLLATLRDPTDNPGRLAVARALARHASPDESAWIDPLFAALTNGDDEALALACADALSPYATRPPVTSRLGQIAQSDDSLSVRLAALQALSSAPTEQAARAIEPLLNSPDPRLSSAAGIALARLAALDDTEPASVLAWMNARTENGDFAETVLVNRAQRAARLDADMRETRATLRRTLSDFYRTADDKAAVLEQFLTSTDANIRLLGAELVYKAVTETGTVAASVKPYVIDLVGDDRPSVRRQAAAALGVLNEPAATQALLTQIEQEPDASVRAALATALGPLRDLSAVPPLMALLRDPSPQVVAASCRSLRRLAPVLRRDDPGLAKLVAAETEDLLLNRTKRGDKPLREYATEAYAAVSGPDGTPTLTRMLLARPREVDEVLVAALNGLAQHGDARAGDAVAELAGHENVRVRQSAVQAMVKTSIAFERADLLRQRLSEANEPSPIVREEAWKSLVALMPTAPEVQLAAWPDRFRDEPRRQLVVYAVLADMAAARKDFEAQSYRLQQIGNLQASLEMWNEAAASLRQSLDIARARPGTQPVVLLSLSRELLTALLRDKQFDEALAFAADLIETDPQYRGDVGDRIRQEIDRLFNANELADAQRLVNAALSMQPPLERAYVERLREASSKIQLRREAGSESRDFGPMTLTALDQG